MKKVSILILMGVILNFCTRGMAEEINLQLPPMPPTIEELTKGKVKIGDLITKDNVDLVKEYLSLGMYQCVKNGMVLRMASNLPPEKMYPRAYLEATERNKGKAVLDDHGVVRLKDGSPWPGGMPFTDPKTGAEVMAYMRFGHAFDDTDIVQPIYYVNKEGKRYKTALTKLFICNTDGRVMAPPFGTVPGFEDQHERLLTVFVYPLELKGLGLITIKHIDDTEKYDVGFAYLPAFKRTIRVSATTYQDNIGGSDMTYGDPTGLREPYSTWNFKLVGKRLMLVTEPVREKQPIINPDGLSVDPKLEYDVGVKYPRLGWTINPECIVEATPKDPGHMYGKKILYICAPYFAHNLSNVLTLMDVYDRSGELWKGYYEIRGIRYHHPNGESYTSTMGLIMYDLQSGHSSHFMVGLKSIDEGMKPDFLSLKKLLELGR